MMSSISMSGAVLLLASLASFISPVGATYDQHQSGTHFLTPAILWDLDRASLDHLIPHTENPLYYADAPGVLDPSKGHKFINIDANFTKPTVVLEHSKYISEVKCTQKGIAIIFNNAKAYRGVKQSWSKVSLGQMGIVTYATGCGSPSLTKRSFWETKSLSFIDGDEGGFVMARAIEVEVEKALSQSRYQWGDYQPSSTKRGPPSVAAIAARGSHTISSGVYTINAAPPNDATFMGQSAFTIYQEGDGGGSSPVPTPGSRRRTRSLEKRSGFGIYCVGCSATGQFQFSGSADIGFSGVSNVEVQFNGQINGNMVLGVSASDSFPLASYSKTLVTIPLSPFGIDGIISIGPQIDLLATAGVTVHAAGEVMGGASVSIGPFQAEAGSQTSASGFDPSFQPTSPQGSGQIGVTASFGVPVQLGFGISAFGFTKTVNIQDEPSISLDATYETAGGGSCSNGVELTATAENAVTINIPDVDPISVAKEDATLASSCAQL